MDNSACNIFEYITNINSKPQEGVYQSIVITSYNILLLLLLHSLGRFIFSTPFTLGGKSHAENIKDQYKRKTILTVEKQFPYVKKRLLVVSKQEVLFLIISSSI